MNEAIVRWRAHNEDYMAAAMSWLCLRLKRLTPSAATAPASSPGGGLFGRKSPAGSGFWSSGADTALSKAADAMAAAEAGDPPPSLVSLSHCLGLTRFEREVLLLCLALELNTRVGALCAEAQGDANRPHATFALALALFADPLWDALSPERPLRYWRLIEVNQRGAEPLTSSPLRVDERILNFVKGLNHLDDRLSPLLVPLDPVVGQRELPSSQQEVVDAVVRSLRGAANGGRPPVVQLVGPDSSSKQLVARHVAASLGLHLYRLPAAMLPPQAADLEAVNRLWQRESLLLPVALYLDAHDADISPAAEAAGHAPPLQRFLACSNGFFFVDSSGARPGLGRSCVTFEVDKPTPVEQKQAWASILDPVSDDSPARLAGQFNLNLASIDHLARTALADESQNGRPLSDRLWDACAAGTRPRLDVLAQRLELKATWEDIVLPNPESEMLRQIAVQVGLRSKVYDEWGFRHKMNRGLGISVLFAGESGTGKTMAAEVIAHDLRLNLYRIDLSAVVSKYIGETEKNLRRLFDAAEDGGAILFFDEADALFGKRSEVKDSHDRYANIEVNYLLQRMEAFHGLAILATNMRNALDQALLRRLRFIVSFPFPGTAERTLIWRKVFPEETPTEGLNFDRLGRLVLTGGSIQNIALNAAFQAAQMDTLVTMPLVLAAARGDFRKLERPINEAEFLWQKPEAVQV